MQRLWYSLYVAIRFQGILELPGLRSVRSWIYARAFNAPGLFVGHGVVMARPHVGRYTRLAIGRNVRIGSHSELDYSGGLEVKDEVIFSTRVLVYTHSHPVDEEPPAWLSGKTQFHSLLIQRQSWLGAGSIILPSCGRIGRGAVIGSGAVVTRPVPDHAVVVGNPAIVKRYRQCVNSVSKPGSVL
jgi:acetyltransferase-like isoleucine patch superfamily enzyme